MIPPHHARLLAESLPTASLALHADDGHVSVLRHLAAAL